MDNIARRFSLSYFINAIGISLVNGILILLLSNAKAYTPEQIGILLGIIPLLTIPSVFVWGRVLDKKKQLMKWLTLLNIAHGIILIGFFFIQNFYLFFIVHLIRTIVVQPTGSIVEEYILNISTESGVPYGKMRVWGTIGYGLAGILSPLIIVYLTIKGVFAAGIIMIVASILFFRLLPEVTVEHTLKKSKANKINWEMLKRRELLELICITGVLFGTLNAASGYGTPMALIKLNCPEAVIGFVPFIMVVFETLFLLIIHKFKVNERPYIILAVAMGIVSLRWLIMSQASHYIVIVISTILHGMIVGMGLPAQNYLIGKIVPGYERSSAILILMTVNGAIVPSLMNLITGGLIDKVGASIFGYTYLLVSFIAFIMLIPKAIKECKRQNT